MVQEYICLYWRFLNNTDLNTSISGDDDHNDGYDDDDNGENVDNKMMIIVMIMMTMIRMKMIISRVQKIFHFIV